MEHTATVNISFPKSLLKHIDEVAQEESRTRSELLREATRMYIERKKRWKTILAFWREESRKENFKRSDIETVIARVRRNKS